ncbi:hypothetical protein BU23DRAFT_308456 [Bimuria novae-zelandiae CBS 107.79]|uniref:Uncharacterized protein n=1 Tax=Bimuria novae-zelandiae CBS 107.79 TaxID=1447943 RepID=A0A6A5UQP3_9PLEO|nr:hypothetical protein BU23DRAFT_308456 [Bimuria novae-zelandiae CBS 107.79]
MSAEHVAVNLSRMLGTGRAIIRVSLTCAMSLTAISQATSAHAEVHECGSGRPLNSAKYWHETPSDGCQFHTSLR